MEENYTYEDLSKKTVAQLRELASGLEHEALQGYTQLHKAELLEKLCEALGVPMHAHHEVAAEDKFQVKKRIRALKSERDQALEAKDSKKFQAARAEIKLLKRRLRKAAS